MVNQQIGVGMRTVRVAVFTGEIAFCGRYRKTTTGNHVVPGLVAILALKIHAFSVDSHMNVAGPFGFLYVCVHIAVFDRITAAAYKMAVGAAGGPAGPADILGHFDKIHVLFGKTRPRRRFFVSLCGVVTDQTVDSGHVREVEIFVFPSITDMTTGAPLPIAVEVDAEVVDGILFFA